MAGVAGHLVTVISAKEGGINPGGNGWKSNESTSADTGEERP